MGKRKWKITIQVTADVTVEVNAKTYGKAIGKAERAALRHAKDLAFSARHVVGSVVALGEPWVGMNWYDLHGPSDVVWANVATGNRLTQEDVDLLRSRINEIPNLEVVDEWNGAGCISVSFRVKGRHDGAKFTTKQLKMLNAPR